MFIMLVVSSLNVFGSLIPSNNPCRWDGTVYLDGSETNSTDVTVEGYVSGTRQKVFTLTGDSDYTMTLAGVSGNEVEFRICNVHAEDDTFVNYGTIALDLDFTKKANGYTGCSCDEVCAEGHCVEATGYCSNSESYCGDGLCHNGETQTSCSSDCGTVTIARSSGGGGGSISSQSSNWDCSDCSECVNGFKQCICTSPTSDATKKETVACTVCTENWKCGSWGECTSDGTRRCLNLVDANNCGTSDDKPEKPLLEACNYIAPRSTVQTTTTNTTNTTNQGTRQDDSKITAQVTGPFGTTSWLWIAALVVLIGGLLLIYYYKRRR